MPIPEAVISENEMIYLSLDNPRFPTRFFDIEAVPWEQGENKLTVTRVSPNAIGFTWGVNFVKFLFPHFYEIAKAPLLLA